MSKPISVLHAMPPGGEPGKGAVGRRQLVDRLNLVNFREESVWVSLTGPDGSNVLCQARPLPCAGQVLDLVWTGEGIAEEVLVHLRPVRLLVPDGAGLLLVDPEPISCSGKGLTVRLPERAQAFNRRELPRGKGHRVAGELTQDGVLFLGQLTDFNAHAFRISGASTAGRSFCGFREDALVDLRLLGAGLLLFSGQCAILRLEEGPGTRSVVVRPLKERILHHPPDPHRDPRVRLEPPPEMNAIHPLSGQMLHLPLEELSSTGFSVRSGTSALPAGLYFPSVRIDLGGGAAVVCRARVLSRKKGTHGDDCALGISDMEPEGQERLGAFLARLGDGRAGSPRVEPDALWEFLFSTGFVYPEKYLHLAEEKEEVSRTFLRLYDGHPEIARHFTVQEQGELLGHLAMLRWHREAWMIQHHAARKSLTLGAGLSVLAQACRSVNAARRLPSAHLHYVFCYFRPENRLPNRLFGDLARHLGDPARCSLDRFAYAFFQSGTTAGRLLSKGWELSLAREADLARFRQGYRRRSGGLVIDAFDLKGDGGDPAELNRAFRSCGFRKIRKIYALRREGRTALVALAEQSDAGLNLSRLTDCVTLWFLEEGVPSEVVNAVLERLSRRYRGHRMPVLIFPHDVPGWPPLPGQREYLLWILNLDYAEDFLLFLDHLLPKRREKGHGPDGREPTWEPHR